MASNKGPARRNGVIGFSMSGAAASAVPSTPTATASTNPFNPTKRQDPPHRNTPLVGPDTAQSFGHANVRDTNNQRSQYEMALYEAASKGNVAANLERKSQREISTLTNQLADAESTIARQEAQRSDALSQVSALQAKLANQHKETARLIDDRAFEAINQAKNSRGNQIDAQFEALEARLEQAAKDLKNAEGDLALLRKMKTKLMEDCVDWSTLRQAVESSEVNRRSQQVRLAQGESFIKKLVSDQARLHHDAMQGTRDNQTLTASQSKTQSVVPSVAPADRPAATPQPANKRKFVPATTTSPSSQVQNHTSVEPVNPVNPFHKVMSAMEPQIRELQQQSGDRTQQSVNTEEVDMESHHSGDSESDVEPSDISMRARSESPIAEPAELPFDIQALALAIQAMSLADTPPPDAMDFGKDFHADEQCPSEEDSSEMAFSCRLFYESLQEIDQEQQCNMEWRDLPDTDIPQPIEFPPRKREPVEEEVSSRSFENGKQYKQRVTSKMVIRAKYTEYTLSALKTRRAIRSRVLARKEASMIKAVLRKPEVTTQEALSESAASQPAQAAMESTETAPTHVTPEEALSVPPAFEAAQATSESIETIQTEEANTNADMSVSALSEPAQTVLESIDTVRDKEVTNQAVLSVSAVTQPAQTVLEEYNETGLTEQVGAQRPISDAGYFKSYRALGRHRFLSKPGFSDNFVGKSALSERAPIQSALTPPIPTESNQSASAVSKATLNGSVLGWAFKDVSLLRHAALARPGSSGVSSLEKLQVTASSSIITPSSPVATDSRAGVSQGTKKVEGAEIPTRSAQKSAGEQREQLGGEESVTGPQMPGTWPSDPPAVTASGESDMQEGSAVLKGLISGSRWAISGALLLVMGALVSAPLWADHPEHHAHTVEGPERVMEELRWDHGFEVPLMERLIYAFLRCFAVDRTLFG